MDRYIYKMVTQNIEFKKEEVQRKGKVKNKPITVKVPYCCEVKRVPYGMVVGYRPKIVKCKGGRQRVGVNDNCNNGYIKKCALMHLKFFIHCFEHNCPPSCANSPPTPLFQKRGEKKLEIPLLFGKRRG
jgi:hypothetical protein